MNTVCKRGLELAHQKFGTPIDRVRDRLAACADSVAEPSAAFIGGTLRQADILLRDVNALDGWRPKAHLVREHLFPSLHYIRRVYARWPRLLLPLAYVHRIVRGTPAWFKRAKQ
jgi:hypothetical protein